MHKHRKGGGFLATIKNSRMINYTKKWWLLGCHARAEEIYSTRGSNDGSRVVISQHLFINGDDKENKGLIHKYSPFVRLRFAKLLFWKEEYNEEQLKKKRFTYNRIYDVCVIEGYIRKEKVKKVISGEEHEFEIPTTANPKAYNIQGFPGYFNGLAKTYDKVAIAVISVLVAIIGSQFIANRLAKKDEPKPTPIINNITTPDVNPVINVYPDVKTPGQ